MRIRHSRPITGAEEEQAAARAVASGMLGRGPECHQFEAELSAYLGTPHVRVTSSGTAALHVALLGVGVQPGDEVVFPSHVCSPVVHAIRHGGAFPVPADIDPGIWTPTPAQVKAVWSVRTKAIVAVHPWGSVVDLEPLREFELPIVENVTQALGGRGKTGIVPGTTGDVAVCSFHATKMITTGHGGCVATRSDALFGRVADVLAYEEGGDGRTRYNYSMSDLHAAVGRVQLRRLGEFVAKRRELAAAYGAKLAGSGLVLPMIPLDLSHVFHSYVVLGPVRDRLAAWLTEAGIEAKKPVLEPAHRMLGGDDGSYPGTTAVDREALSLPLHPGLSVWEVEEVASRVLECLRSA